MSKPLEPPDLERCQGESVVSNPWVLGGSVVQRTRCSAAPAFIARETKPGKDGRKGSMSLCAACKPICESQLPNVSFKKIARKRK